MLAVDVLTRPKVDERPLLQLGEASRAMLRSPHRHGERGRERRFCLLFRGLGFGAFELKKNNYLVFVGQIQTKCFLMCFCLFIIFLKGFSWFYIGLIVFDRFFGCFLDVLSKNI